MNKMEMALHELLDMDAMAAQQSPVHKRHPAAKLITTVCYILIVVSFHKYDLGGLMPMVLWPVALFQVSGIPVGTCFYKLRIVLPLVLAVGLFNPLFDHQVVVTIGRIGIWGGVISMVTLMLKGLFCLMASFLLVATTPIDLLCGALRQMHFPGTLVTLFLLTYRYVGVLTEELAIMTDAYHLRAPGQKGIQPSAWGSFLGQLLLRSMDRAQELYANMLLRGYHEHFHYAPLKKAGAGDVLYIVIGCVFFFVLRIVPVMPWIGSLLWRG